MSYNIMYTPSIKTYLVKGKHIRELRQKYGLGFMEFCRRSGLSTRTLASIEQSQGRIIQDQTMTKIMRGFNITRQGLRRKLLPVDRVAEGCFSIKSPFLERTETNSIKLTVYLDKTAHRGVLAYARKYGFSKNKAVVQVLKDQLHIVEDGKDFERYSSAFDTLKNQCL